MPTPLILKRASLLRSSGQWSDDDYDVLGKALGAAAKEIAQQELPGDS